MPRPSISISYPRFRTALFCGAGLNFSLQFGEKAGIIKLYILLPQVGRGGGERIAGVCSPAQAYRPVQCPFYVRPTGDGASESEEVHMKKTFLSILFALILCIGLLPTAALADDPSKVASVTVDGTTTEYATFVDANSAVFSAEGSTITVKLLDNIEESLSGYMFFGLPNKTFTLDLNGHSLKITQDGGIIMKLSGGSMTITDSVGGGVLAGTGSSSSALKVAGGSLTVTGSKPFTLGYVVVSAAAGTDSAGTLTVDEGTGAVFNTLVVENTGFFSEEDHPTVTLNGGTYNTLRGVSYGLMEDGKAFANATTGTTVTTKEDPDDSGSYIDILEQTNVKVVSHETCDFHSGPVGTGMCVCGRECDHGADKTYNENTGLCECNRMVAVALVTGGTGSSIYYREIDDAFTDVAERSNGKLTLQYAQNTLSNSVTISTLPTVTGDDGTVYEETDWQFPSGTYTVDLNGVTLNAECNMEGFPTVSMCIPAGANVTLTNSRTTGYVPYIGELEVTGGSLTIPAAPSQAAKTLNADCIFRSGALTVAEGANVRFNSKLMVYSSTGVSLAGGEYNSLRRDTDATEEFDLSDLLADGGYTYYGTYGGVFDSKTEYTNGSGLTSLSNARVEAPQDPEYEVECITDYVSGYCLILVYTNDDVTFSFNEGGMYDVTSAGYKYNGTAYDHVYATVVYGRTGDPAETISTETLKAGVKTDSTAVIDTLTYSLDVNNSDSVDLRDAVAVVAVYNVNETYMRNHLPIVLKADVSHDKKVDASDFGKIKAEYLNS